MSEGSQLLSSLLLEGSECEWVEFKINNSDPDTLGQNISAVSNSAALFNKPYAYIVFGVHGSTLEVVGTKFYPRQAKKGNEEIENWLTQSLDPKVDFRFIETSYDGHHVVIIRIPAASEGRPLRFRNISYVRIGSYTKPLHNYPEKEKQLWQPLQPFSFEEKIAISPVTDDQIYNLLDTQAYSTLTTRNKNEPLVNILARLIKDKLVVVNQEGGNAITNLGAILIARDISHFDRLQRRAVRIVRYQGKNKLKAFREEVVYSGYASGFESVLDKTHLLLPSIERIDAAFRIDQQVYPALALRELIANALIHQDLSATGASPMVEIFDDRVEISNPGAPSIDIDRLMDHTPESRNDALARMMRLFRICEERGSGIDKVVDECEQAGLPAPEWISGQGFTRAILYSPRPLRLMRPVDRIRACYQHACLRYLSNDVMTNQSLRERLRISEKNYPMASRIIRETREHRLIAPVQEDRRASTYVPFWAAPVIP